MVINEIFYSLQGEGRLAGVPSVFIRIAGCPLRCRWCDTKYAWDKTAGRQYTIGQIIRAIRQFPPDHIVITGGEPMVDPDLPQLARELNAAAKHITIETAGIAYLPDLPCDLMSISPKLTNSTPPEQDRRQKSVIRSLAPTPVVGDGRTDLRIQKFSGPDIAVLRELIDNYDYQLKFVVDFPDDLPEIQETLNKLKNPDVKNVMLMPQAATREELLAKSPMVADLCKQTGFTLSQRLQVLLWDNQKGV